MEDEKWSGLRWIRLCLFGAAIPLNLGALFLLALTPVISVGLSWGFRGFAVVLSIPSIVFGILILRLHPRHAIGWFLLLFGFGTALYAFLTEYVLRALFIAPGSLPAGVFGVWLSNWIWVPFTLMLALMLLCFPAGQLLSARWRIIVLFVFLVLIVLAGSTMFSPGPMTSSIGHIPNPFGFEGLTYIFDTTLLLGYIGWILALVFSAISLLLRFRRSRGMERQQIKWILYAAAVLALVSPASVSDSPWLQSLIILGTVFVLAAIGIAILRYRLFDIDIIIRRTATYALVVVLLLVVYFGSVILLQQLFSSITSSGQNEIVTVISTLAIAALFVPVRNRIQLEIDRRFNRKKYDAQQVLSDFANTVRDETDLEKLAAELLNVVNETIQPKSVQLWLSPMDKQRKRERDL